MENEPVSGYFTLDYAGSASAAEIDRGIRETKRISPMVERLKKEMGLKR